MSLYSPIAPKELHTLLNSKASNFELIDIRSVKDYQTVHIPSAISLPLASEEFLNFTPSKEIGIFYCHSSRRTSEHLDDLEEFGFKHIYTIIGGIIYWQQMALPLCEKGCNTACYFTI